MARGAWVNQLAEFWTFLYENLGKDGKACFTMVNSDVLARLILNNESQHNVFKEI